jgi:sugar O-acyltransferase (sialic acid O-acetyltransferase NeuD family)
MVNRQSKALIIIGAGGQARVVIDVASELNIKIVGIIDVNFQDKAERILGFQVLGDFAALNQYPPHQVDIAIALGDSHLRSEYYEKVIRHGYRVITMIHPTAIVSRNAKIGNGVFINAGVIINAGAVIQDNSIINTGVIIEHETVVGKHCHIAPGVKLAGRVKIGDNTFVGIGSTIIDKIMIGDNVVIGAGSVILRDVDSKSTVVGIPGKKIK